MTEEMSIIGSEAYNAAKEILEAACLVEGDLFVVGCSTSEVAGAGIGTFSSPELAEVVFGSIYQATQETGDLSGRPVLRASQPGPDTRKGSGGQVWVRDCQRDSPAKGGRGFCHGGIQDLRGAGGGGAYQGQGGHGHR